MPQRCQQQLTNGAIENNSSNSSNRSSSKADSNQNSCVGNVDVSTVNGGSAVTATSDTTCNSEDGTQGLKIDEIQLDTCTNGLTVENGDGVDDVDRSVVVSASRDSTKPLTEHSSKSDLETLQFGSAESSPSKKVRKLASLRIYKHVSVLYYNQITLYT